MGERGVSFVLMENLKAPYQSTLLPPHMATPQQKALALTSDPTAKAKSAALLRCRDQIEQKQSGVTRYQQLKQRMELELAQLQTQEATLDADLQAYLASRL
jgi:hypothetical protein